MAQRHHDRGRRGEGGDPVGEAERRQGRRPVRGTGHRGKTAHRLGESAETGPATIRTGLAEASDACDHEPGVAGVQLFRADAPVLERARPEVLDEDVGLGHEVQQDRLGLRLREIQRDRPLVTADHLPPQVDPVLQVTMRPNRIAPGVLDLHDIGAEISQQRRRERASEECGQIQHLDALERSGGLGGVHYRGAEDWVAASCLKVMTLYPRRQCHFLRGLVQRPDVCSSSPARPGESARP